MFNKKYLKTIIFATILSIEVIGLTGCNSSKKEIKITVTIGEYPLIVSSLSLYYKGYYSNLFNTMLFILKFYYIGG
ncbi:hypothetical protein AB2Z22_001016 [Clostridium botulinum]|nr:hypothetical protein [Clostridium botulinum]